VKTSYSGVTDARLKAKKRKKLVWSSWGFQKRGKGSEHSIGPKAEGNWPNYLVSVIRGTGGGSQALSSLGCKVVKTLYSQHCRHAPFPVRVPPRERRWDSDEMRIPREKQIEVVKKKKKHEKPGCYIGKETETNSGGGKKKRRKKIEQHKAPPKNNHCLGKRNKSGGRWERR